MNINEGEQTQIAIEDEEISVPNWLLEVIAFITRMEMANPPSMATSCRLFKQLCWSKLHGDVEPHRVADLNYSKHGFHDQNWIGSSHPLMKKKTENGIEVIPIANSPSPNYIIGFGKITICFLDEQIIEFMRNVAPLFPNNFVYSSRTEGWNSNEERTGKMRRLLATMRGQIYQFCSNNYNIHIFDCQLFPRVLDHVQEEIYFSKCEKESGMMLLNWLTNNNGRLKTLYLQNIKGKRPLNGFVKRIKEEFSKAISSSKFIVHPGLYLREFKMENEKTGEILELYSNGEERKCFLARYPKGERNTVTDWWTNRENRIDFYLEIY